MRFVVTLALLALAGCNCNDPQQGAGSDRAKMKAAKFKAAKMKMKARGPVETIPASIWLIDTKKLEAADPDPWVKVERQIGAKTPAKNTVWQLFKGPTPEETAQGLTLFRSGTEGFQDFTLEGTTATLQLRGGCESGGGAFTIYDHLSKTLKSFPEVQQVRVLGPDGTTQAPEGDSKPACLEP